MRYLLTTVMLLAGASSLSAGAFLDRFNALERDVTSLQNSLDEVKQKIGAGSSGKSSKGLSSKELKDLKEAIELIKAEQEVLHLKLKKMASTPAGKASGKASASVQAGDIDIDPEEIQEQFDEISRNISDIKKFTNDNHLKLGVDFRTSYDGMRYVMADGSRHYNDGLLTNRLWIDMKYMATPNISFTGQLAYNKQYGTRRGTGSFEAFDDFDWIVNENYADDTVRVKKAYYFYRNDTFLDAKIPWTFSLGRRPSTNGHLINLRDDDPASSPLGHSINVEFDGGSSKFDISQLTGISGMYLKLCFGRGLTNAQEKFSSTPYATNSADLNSIDLAGLIFSIYNNGQYSLTTQTYKAWNLIDLNATYQDFETVGNLSSFTVNFLAEGIGENWGAFFDDTTFFFSYAESYTQPEETSMFGSWDRQKGYSFWTGFQFPSMSDRGKIGIEYNEGSKYWRSITYAEDTAIGSKVAARGKAYEIYWTEPFADNSMSWQLRYTYIDYHYTGSNGFFGSVTGTPYTMAEAIGGGMGAQVVDSAEDLRLYLRYRY